MSSTVLTYLTICMLAQTVALAKAGSFEPTPSRAPDSVAVRPYYKWEVSLGRETKAVVGPIDAEKVIKVRLDHTDSADFAVFPDETINVCIDRYCETVDLAPAGNDSLASIGPEVDFTQRLSAMPGNYRKTYLTFQRKSPSAADTITLSVKVETDHTSELPLFTVLPAELDPR